MQGECAHIWEKLTLLERLELAAELEKDADMLRASVYSRLCESKSPAWLEQLAVDFPVLN